MKPEVESLVGLIARSVYERWKAGELPPNVMPGPAGAKKVRIPSTALVAYDPSSNMPEMELLGCVSTHTPGTARTGKQKPPLPNGVFSVVLKDNEDVECAWTSSPDGVSYVTGYTILRRAHGRA